MLPARVARLGAPLLLCPANLAPAVSRRTVLVLHDAAALRHPAWYSGVYAAWQRRLLPVLAARARRIVTVRSSPARSSPSCSASTRRACRWCRAGSTGASRRPRTRRARGGRSGSTGPTCCAWPRTRRARTSARSCPRRGRSRRDGVELAVAGGHRPQFAAEQGLDALRLLGHVDDALLPGLYAGAEAFALPSLYEGFGLPVLEAMAAGTPVLTTTAGALPETCGGAARLVEDPAAFAHRAAGAARRHGRARPPARGRAGARPGVLLGADGARDRRAADRGRGLAPA